ncbi:MAG: hypothetical protein M0P26_01050 [Bacteroidales bacterium]|nr:hypothetical protein [Bacteroidales bacterium]
MNWLKRVLGFKEPASTPVSNPDPIIKGDKFVGKPVGKFANACEENTAFINEHWELYPDYIKEHILNYREINKIDDLYGKYRQELHNCRVGMRQYLELAKEAESSDISLSGTRKIIAEYDAKTLNIWERINALPGTSHLRNANSALEARAAADGWVCWYGTGGLHWNKKGIVQDGSGIYRRR